MRSSEVRLGRGLLFVLEGIDQSGKRTQTLLLTQRISSLGHKVRSISFPIYDTPIGAEIKASLEGKRSYPPQVKHLLLSANRWEVKLEMENLLEEGWIIIANRYTPSNIAYGLASGIDEDWLMSLDRGLPKPDLVIIIDIPPQVSLARKVEDRDMHERDLSYLSRVRENYLMLAKRFGWIVVDGDRDISQVHEEIWDRVKDLILGSSGQQL